MSETTKRACRECGADIPPGVDSCPECGLLQTAPALAELDTVLAAAPRHENALYNRGVVLLSLGRSDEADKAWGLYLDAHPDAPHSAEVRTRLGAKGHGFGAAAEEKKKTYP